MDLKYLSLSLSLKSLSLSSRINLENLVYHGPQVLVLVFEPQVLVRPCSRAISP